MSADRIAAQLARQPGLGSAGPSAMPPSAPQAAPAIVTLLRASAPTFISAWNCPVASAVTGTASMPPLRGSAMVSSRRPMPSHDPGDRCTANALSAVSRHGPIRWHQRLVSGGARASQADWPSVWRRRTLLLNWLAVTRLVAPVGRIVHGLENLDAAGTRPPLPRFAATEFDRIARACNALASRLALTEAERAGLVQRLVTVQEEERKALARDLHDAFGQCLAAAGARAAAIELAAPRSATIFAMTPKASKRSSPPCGREPTGSPGPPRTARSRRSRIGGGAA